MERDFLIKEGERYGDFLLTEYTPIEELQLVFRQLLHIPTGAEVMHLQNEDPENLFCLAFRTLPRSSDGAAHILEHTVLCGSRKYPIRDPFFSMGRRSLNTFMNAMTGADFTCYPAASQVEKDFYNLLEVYIDSVFHPQLKEHSFLQEGHRYEFATATDPSTPLEIKGIVYNEMKGAMSSADSRIWQALMEELVPGLPYAFNSGGDPKVIPHLSYEELIDFHETFYHPSRCLFFFYGNFPLKKKLDFIQTHALKGVPRLPPLESIGHQKRFTTPVRKEFFYPIAENDSLESKHMFAIGFLTAPLLSQEEVLALSILDSALMDTDASPLRKALLETKLCIHVDSIIDLEMTDVPFAFIFKGCAAQNRPLLEQALRQELIKIAEEGIPYELITSSLHQLELSRTEIGGGHSPFGLTLFFRSGLAKMHGCNPIHALTSHSLFEEVLEKIKNPKYFSPIIKKYLIDNPHFVSLSFAPSADLSSRESAEEQELLKKVKAELTEKEVAKILEQSKSLEEIQNQEEGTSLDCLPKVSLEDVPAEVRHFPLTSRKQKNLQIHHHDVFTNHIVYADFLFDLPDLSEEELVPFQLFLFFWNELGTEKRTFEEKLHYLHAHTGGIATHASLHVQAADPTQAKPSLQTRGKALGRNIDKLLPMFEEMILYPRFDERERVKQLLEKLLSSLQNRLTQNAMRYASQLSLASSSIPSWINEQWYGLTFYQKMMELGKDIEAATDFVMGMCEKMKHRLLTVGSPHLVISSDLPLFNAIDKAAFFNLPELRAKQFAPWKGDFSPPKIGSRAYEIPSQVAFSSQGMNTISYLHKDSASLLLATTLLENQVLHQKIREQGGAYGAGATYNPLWGNFYLHSYRDPHISRTFRTFSQGIEEIAGGEFDESDLEEAKLGIIQHADSPTSPGSRAITSYSNERDGKTRQIRQQFRDRLLAATSDDIERALQEHILPHFDQGIKATFAGKELLDRELPLIDGELVERLSIS